MNKLERKARMKAMKQARKQARRAAREGEAAQGPESAAPEPQIVTPLAPPEPITEARELYMDSDTVSEAEAIAMLSRAARLLDCVIQSAHDALTNVPRERIRQATEVIEAEKAPASNVLPAQQRPRRGHDPVITLLKLSISATSLQKRVRARWTTTVTRRAAEGSLTRADSPPARGPELPIGCTRRQPRAEAAEAQRKAVLRVLCSLCASP
jgi:hypothetical protein